MKRITLMLSEDLLEEALRLSGERTYSAGLHADRDFGALAQVSPLDARRLA